MRTRRESVRRLRLERLEERAVLAAIAVDLGPTFYRAIVSESFRTAGVPGGGVVGPVTGTLYNQPTLDLQIDSNPSGMNAHVAPPQGSLTNGGSESYSNGELSGPVVGRFNFSVGTGVTHGSQDLLAQPGDFYHGSAQATLSTSVELHFNPEANGEDYVGRPMYLSIAGDAFTALPSGTLHVRGDSGIDLTNIDTPSIEFDNFYPIRLGDSLTLSWSSNLGLIDFTDPTEFAEIFEYANVVVRLIVPPNIPPVVTLPTPSTWNEDSASVLVAPTATIADTDSLDFSNGYVRLYGNASSDVFRLRNEGTGPGQISVTSQGTVSYSGTPVATANVSQGSIDVQLRAGVSRAAAEAILRNITYRSMAGEPGAGAQVFSLEVSDGDGPATIIPLTVQVLAVNDAPQLNTSLDQSFSEISEDTINPTGDTIESLLTGVSDADASALQGLAITQVTGASTGKWQYSLNGGNTWLAVGTVSSASALLLPSNGEHSKLRYVPNSNMNGLVQIAYRAWDQTQGMAGSKVNLSSTTSIGSTTAYSFATERATLTVIAVNDAPRLSAVTIPALTAINEDATNPFGDSIQSLLLGATDVDAGALTGVALTQALGSSTGQWQYTLNGGASWINVGLVSNSSALLIPSNGTQSRLRYLPKANFNGTVQMAFRAWDQTQGSVGGTANLGSSTLFGGMTAYSATLLKNTLTVHAVNDAPRLNLALTPTLTTIQEDATNPIGDSVQSLLVGASDVDALSLRGLAITQVTGASTGKWQFTLNGGSGWTDIGIVTGASALLVSVDTTQTRLRYLPKPNFNGSVQVAYRAWDQTQGTTGTKVDISAATLQGGTSAYSVEMARATLTIAAVNDAPQWISASPVSFGSIVNTVANSPDYLISSMLGTRTSDADAGAQNGIAVWGIPASSAARVWYQLSGSTTWIQITSASATSALLLPSNAKLRFSPVVGVTGPVQIRFAVWDRTAGTTGGRVALGAVGATGGSTALSSSFGTAVLNVT